MIEFKSTEKIDIDTSVVTSVEVKGDLVIAGTVVDAFNQFMLGMTYTRETIDKAFKNFLDGDTYKVLKRKEYLALAHDKEYAERMLDKRLPALPWSNARGTGKTFRALLGALYTASCGEDVLVVTNDVARAHNLCNEAREMAGESVVARGTNDMLVLANGATISFKSTNYLVATKEQRSYKVIKDVD